jgi:thioester reductase-like protein
MFMSSIGTTQSWPRDKGPYPEEMQHEARYAVGSGYGEAKYICERVCAFLCLQEQLILMGLLAQMLENSGLQASSFRIGQITGPVPNGCWATTDWVALLVKSSMTMGVFPDLAGTVAWLPVTAVSAAITDVLLNSDPPPLALNIVHPYPVKWTTIMSAMCNEITKVAAVNRDGIRLIPFASWFSQLERAAQTTREETLHNMVC